jgi:hypothetical protein
MTHPIAEGISKASTASTTSKAGMAELGMDLLYRHIPLMNSVEAPRGG